MKRRYGLPTSFRRKTEGPTKRSFGMVVGLILAVFVIGLAPAPVRAQDLTREIQNLKRDLADLQRFVYNGQTGTPPQPVGSAATGGEETGGDIAARLQVRIQEIERQLRDLTGRLEEVQFKNRQLEQRLNTALQDIDFRLTALEGGTPASAAPGTLGGQAGTVIGAAAPPAGAQPVIPIPQGASGQGVLGQGASGQATTIISSEGTQTAPQPQGGTLGSLIVDAQGNVIGGKANPDATVGSGPVGPVAGAQTAPPPPTTVQAPVAVEGGDLATPGAGATASLPDQPQALYDYSLGLMRQAQYPEAEAALKVFLDRYPRDNLVGAALYWLGETYYVRQNYRDAAFAFVDVYGKHKTSPKAPDSLLKLGMSLHALGNAKEACTAFKTLKAEYPDARRAVLKLAEERAAEYGCS